MNEVKLSSYIATWNKHTIGFHAANEVDAKKFATKLFQHAKGVKVTIFK